MLGGTSSATLGRLLQSVGLAYNDALDGGHLRGRTAKDITDILVVSTDLKDRSIYSDMVVSAVDPDGKTNVASLNADLAFFKELGLINGTVTVAQAIDEQFQQAALKELGPYKPRQR